MEGPLKTIFRAFLLFAAFLAASLPAAADPVDFPRLMEQLEGLGYTPKLLSKEGDNPKSEITATSGSWTVHLSFEVSPSKRFIWVSAFLGDAGHITGDKALGILKREASIQPTGFWITGAGGLMIGMYVDNRDVTPDHLKFVIDKLVRDVEATSGLWAPPPAAATP